MTPDKHDTERVPVEPPVIKPLDQKGGRPVWSVMIPVFNCSNYLAETLRSVLSQGFPSSEMQIEVIDDDSNDADIKKLVDEIGSGRVAYFKQPKNVGSIRNFQTCIERSRGHLIHILHGDDRLRNGFYNQFNALFRQFPEIGAAFCRYAYIDEQGQFLYNQKSEMDTEGILNDWLVRLGERQRIQYVSMVVKREVYETLGSFYGVEYGEDWEMWMRIAAKYKMGYIPTVLAEYRRHESSISGKSFLTGKNMRELEVVMDHIQHYLPEDKREEVIKTSRKFYSHYALKTANALWKNLRHKSGAVAQVKAAWNMSRDVKLLYKIIKLYTRITLNI